MTAITSGGTTLFSTSSLFDKLDRLSSRTLTGGAYTQTIAYAYEWGTTLPQSVTVNGSTVSYTYDAAGNITTITDGSLVTYYTYDSLNQLVREDNAYSNKTVVYAYDNGGNILTKTEYPYSPTVEDVTTLTATNTVTYAYENTDWKDQLTSFNGEAITYDEIGNPLSYRGMTLTWQNGRELASITKTGLNASYVYNDDGLRTQKTVNGVTTEYYWNGSQLLGQKTGDNYLYFLYDERGMLVGFNDGTKTYLYTRNLQGEIISVTDTYAGTTVANYVYDSWGNVLTATGVMAEVNPIRYKGYYYDSEIGLYYLQTRYYDPQVGRFINADSFVSTGQDLTGFNMYAYCGNNPVSRVDESGQGWLHWLVTAAVVVVAAAAVVVTAGGAAAGIAAVASVSCGVAAATTASTVAAGAFLGAATVAAGEVIGAALTSKSADEFAEKGNWGTVGSTVGGAALGALNGYSMAQSQKKPASTSAGKNENCVKETTCFIAGTLIQTAGGACEIEEIKEGMLVYAADPESGESGLRRVVNTFKKTTNELIHVSVNGEEIVTTPTHPFWRPKHGWTKAVELRAGDILLTSNGEYVVVEQVQHEILEAPVEVYNFEVEDFHTYYVGVSSVLVHNKCDATFVPEKYWTRNASKVGTPNSTYTHYKYNVDTRQWERSTVFYDSAGRQAIRIDWTNHGCRDHGNPHVHITTYGVGFEKGRGMRID